MKTPTIKRLLVLVCVTLLVILAAVLSSMLTPQALEAALNPLGLWAPVA